MNPGPQILILNGGPKTDVLRTTCLLKPLKKKFPGAEIIWITKDCNIDILQHNPEIRAACSLENGGTIAILLNRKFRDVYSLDMRGGMDDLANLVESEHKFGIRRTESGQANIFNREAGELFDYLNDSPPDNFNYQKSVMHAAQMDDSPPGEMILNIGGDWRNFAEKFLLDNSLKPGEKPVVMMSLTAGPRRGNIYPDSRSVSFITEQLTEKLNAVVILIAGPDEKAFYENYLNACRPGIIAGGCENSLMEFFGLMEKCDLYIGMDSIGIHGAIALGKPAVVLRNPRIGEKLELYGRGKEIFPGGPVKMYENIEMVSFSPEEVTTAAKELLNR